MSPQTVTDIAALRALLNRRDHAGPPQPRPSGNAETDLSPESLHLLAAWKSWRGERLLPRRRDMNLVSIARLMPALSLLEVSGPQRAVFRLAGSDIERLVGQRLTGRNFVTLAEPGLQAARGAMLWAAATQPCGIAGLQAISQSDGSLHRIQQFALPILPDLDGAPVQLLVVTSRLPDLSRGVTSTDPLHLRGEFRQFIELGGGLPLIQA